MLSDWFGQVWNRKAISVIFFFFWSPILFLLLIPNGNIRKAQSGLPRPLVAHPYKPGTTTCRVQGVARSSLPLASALQGVVARAMPCFHTCSWVFSNSLLTIPQKPAILFRRLCLPPPTPSLVLSRFGPQSAFASQRQG